MAETKVYFVRTCREERAIFDRLLPEARRVYVDSIQETPKDAKILSVLFDERIDKEFLDAHPRLKIIAARSTSCDSIDLGACKKRGIEVRTVEGYGENTVAEHVFALLLAITRRLRTCYDSVRLGRLDRESLRGIDIFRKTLGVIGVGRVGQHVIRVASGFQMRVLGYDTDPHPFYTELLDFEYTDLETLLKESDFLTLHVPLNSRTEKLIRKETLALCKPGVILINTARGSLLDMDAVVEGLDSGHIGGLGLDVLEDESVFRGGASNILGEQIARRVRGAGDQEKGTDSFRLEEIRNVMRNHRALQHPNVVFTPHTAYNSTEAVIRICELTVENIRPFLDGSRSVSKNR